MKSERWSTHNEIRKVLTPDHVKDQGGPILEYRNGHHWKYTGEGHTIIVGSTGSGKSRRCSIPMVMSMLKAKESLVCADPKGEIYSNVAHLLTEEYKVVVLDFRHILDASACNILAPIVYLYKTGREEDKQAAMEMLDYVAGALYPLKGKDPFWELSAQSVFIGAVRTLMDHAAPEAVTIFNVFQLITKGDERFGGPGNTYLKELISLMPSDSTAAMELHSYAHTADDTRSGIRSTFLQNLAPFIRSDGIISMMSGDDLKIHKLDGETPTAIFIIIPDESPTYDGICGIIVNELLTHYVRMAHDRYNGRLPRRLNMVLEEFGSIGHAIPNLPPLLAAGRSRNIRCHIILQTFAQLVDIYDPAKATSVRENAGVMIAYRSTHYESLSELSRLCGEREVERNGHFLREPLITPSDLSAMQVGQALVMITGGIKFITWLPDFTEVFPVDGAKAPERPPRSTRKPPVHFDIQKYVKEAKQRKMDEMMNRHPDPFRAMAQAPVATPKPETSFDIAKLVAKIDAKIAELKEEEKSGEQDQTGHFTVTLVSCVSKLSVMKILRNHMPLSLREAKDIVDDLPFKKTFTSIKEAKAFASELTEATGTVTTEGF